MRMPLSRSTSSATRSRASLIRMSAAVRPRSWSALRRSFRSAGSSPHRASLLHAACRRRPRSASSWAIVRPPASRTAPRPSAPSRPMPVSTTATPAPRALAAMLRSRASPDGRCSPAGRRAIERESAVRRRGRGRRRRARAQTPGCAGSVLGEPDRQGYGGVEPACEAVREPRAMCWTTRIGIGKLAGMPARTVARACGPPVEAQIPITEPRGAAGFAAVAAAVQARRADGGCTRAAPSSLTRRRKANAAASSGFISGESLLADRVQRSGGEGRRGDVVGRRPRGTKGSRIGVGRALMISSTASSPDIPGSSMSIVTRCGCQPRKVVRSPPRQCCSHSDHLDLASAFEHAESAAA